LHASETVGSQQLMEMVYQMVSRTDPETMRLLNDIIGLYVLANPDGQELVANWYMREKDPLKRSMGNLPRLWEKYIGHDNNRDSLTSNMPETTNMNRQLYIEWNPQIMYNHHQSGPAGEVVFIPPFRDPINHNLDGLIPLGIQAVGTAMHTRLVSQGKGGSGMRTQANYDGWWDGGMRNTATYHNTIAILTEIIGNPTPMQIPLVPERQLFISDIPLPIAPQSWHYRQSIDYEMENNRAILDYASRNKEDLLYNFYRMGMNSIEKGSHDSWTITPKRVAALEEAAAKSGEAGGGRRGGGGQAAGGDSAGGTQTASVPAELYEKVLHDPAFRDPRGYIIPSNQADFGTATTFVNSLLKSGISVLKATAPFQVAGKTYPASSYIVKSDQAFRPFVRDSFEPQDHPNDVRYPGGPPIAPYDIAGWTLAMQMGVQFDRILEGFNGPFAKVTGLQKPLPGTITGAPNPAGYLISHQTNNSFILTNRLFKAGADVYWLKSPVTADGQTMGAGTLWIPASSSARPVLEEAAQELGITAHAVGKAPSSEALKLKPVRIGLFDRYGGLMPSGWTRWLFEQFEFPFEVVYPQTLDAGELRAKFDVLVFTDGVRFNGAGRGGGGGGRQGNAADPENVPEEFRAWMGNITEEKTLPQIQKFVESGGNIVTIGSSTSMAGRLGVPVGNFLTETANGTEHALGRDKFYIPGSLMRAKVDNSQPLAYGMPDTVDFFFDNSPVFSLAGRGNDAQARSVHPIARFEGKNTLDSGWAWGQEHLDGGTAVAEAQVGEGKVLIMGPEVAFRGEPHATFKLLFNGLYYGNATSTEVR
jgi:hypothetical protein